ncbi:radical SAM protein [Prosthecochloris vibrioformis]|uniref:Radical SAM protein n=1 Tax=Prosthecochloris vibrioformis TaxID=1098 RepID=A0A5C4RU60_PROVB|nr:radical SAM protein [Prosthecochloris vibrioformis]TNJ34167.1 radical SAM protein [Prosthecochloris vibrioformis]
MSEISGHHSFRKVPLTHAMVLLTNRCNATCSFCECARLERASVEHPAEPWISTIAQLHRAGARRVVISGGEPLLHPGFTRITEYAASIMKRVIICTNGILLDSCDPSLFSIPSLQWTISVHSADAAHHDAITDVPGAFARIERFLAEVHAHRATAARFAFNATCCDVLTDFRPLIAFAARTGVEQLTINPLWSAEKGNCPRHLEDLSQAERDRAFAEASGVKVLDFRFPSNVSPPGCYEVLSGMVINPQGECFPCMNAAGGFRADSGFSYGNALSGSIADIRSSQRYRDVLELGHRRSLDFCSTCHAPVRQSSLYEYLQLSTSGALSPFLHHQNKAIMPQGG